MCFLSAFVAVGRMNPHLSVCLCVLIVRLLGTTFLPCALLVDMHCDMGCQKFQSQPRIAFAINACRWPLACLCTTLVVM